MYEKKVDVTEFHDGIAGSYDELLAEGFVAGIIRKTVHTKLLNCFKPGQRVLDLNCGTGIDAIFLAKNGIYVTATDISPKMIDITRSKIKSENLNEYIDTFILDSENLPVLKEKSLSFDGVVSNFNGLNYLNDLRKFAQQLSALLKPGAPALFTMLNKFYMREVLYYISRLKLSRGFNKATAREKTLATRMKLYFPRTVKKSFHLTSQQKKSLASVYPHLYHLPSPFIISATSILLKWKENEKDFFLRKTCFLQGLVQILCLRIYAGRIPESTLCGSNYHKLRRKE